jgi:eukaryotic-like serine/threonine-protein kinase
VSADSLEGRNLGKYRVLEPLGRGGMARVYRAYHPQLDRYVAIKVLRSDLVEEEEFLVRFQREARAVAALRHPNIV